MSNIRTTTARAAEEVRQESRRIATNPKFAWVARLGYAARGIVFIIVGVFVCVAALQSKPAAARGFGGALQALLAQPFGTVLLFIVALGLIAFAIYSLIETIFHQFAPAKG